jgi:hypothetical protein
MEVAPSNQLWRTWSAAKKFAGDASFAFATCLITISASNWWSLEPYV